MPIVLFESGLGASEFYGTTPIALFEFFEKLGYQLFTLKNYVKSSSSLSKEEFNPTCKFSSKKTPKIIFFQLFRGFFIFYISHFQYFNFLKLDL